MDIRFKKNIYLSIFPIAVVFLFCFYPYKTLAADPHCTDPYSPVILLDVFDIRCCKYAAHPCDSAIDPTTSFNNSRPVCCHLLERCGNGRLEPGEACDDNNNNSGDGCNSNCQIETNPSPTPTTTPTPTPGNQDLNPLKAKTFGELFDSIIGTMFWVAIVLCPLLIITGGFLIMFAGLDMNKIVLGKKIILYTSVILGIILIIKAMTSFFASDVTFL
ncbi:MAG: myxococcus cysteine-rich repeat containing protein [Candidatus Parcubacteria bacterium]|nr:myxococcus cysteine-rich repeat containing protein [Candidatus Parcubacteria bacterium]